MWIIVRVYDLFLISFSGENSPNQVISSCQNAITHKKPHKITLSVRFLSYKLSIYRPGNLICAEDFVAKWFFHCRDYCTWAGYPD